MYHIITLLYTYKWTAAWTYSFTFY